MKKTALFKRILWMLLVAVLMLGAHAAAEEGHQVQLQLLRDGYLPEQKPANMLVLRGETFEEYVLKKIEARETVFDVSDYRMKPEDMAIAFSQLLDGNPRLFFVDGTFWYWHDADGYITDMQIDYVYSETEIAKKLAAFDASVNAIVSYASQADTTLGKIMMVHDYLCVNYEYDNTLEIHSAEEMFRLKTGVCQGYTQCFQAVMNAMGIECKPALSLAMNHVWNMVKVNGSWYHIDVTWDDPVSDMPLRARHQYFMLSDAGMLANEHYDWTSVVSATSKTYDSYFWSDVNNTIPVVGDLMYYVDTQTAELNRTIKAWDLSAGAASNVYTYSIAAADGSYWYYFGYNPIAVGNDWLYYATVDRVYGMPLQGGTPVLMHTASGEDAIFSCWFNGSQLKAYVGESLGNGTVITLDVPAAVPVPYEYTDNGDGTCTITGYTGTDKALEIPAELGGLTVTAIGNSAFEGHNLESVTLPSTLESLGSWAFFFHYDLTEITLPASLTEIGLNPFGGTGLTTIAVDEANTAFKTDGKALYTMDGTVLKFFAAAAEGAYAVPEGVTAIEAEAFSAATKVTEVTMPSTLKTIGDYAFSEATGLEKINLPESIEFIGQYAFAGCGSLTATVMQNSYAEEWCMDNGVDTVWPSGESGDGLFTYIIRHDGTASITAYRGNASHVEVPSSINGVRVTMLGIGAFRGSNMSTISLPEGLEVVAMEAFAYCENLQSIHLPSTVRGAALSAFGPYCGAAEITVASGNTNLCSVDGVLFEYGMERLIRYPSGKTDRSYTVPAGVKEIYDGAFEQNYHLEEVVLPEGFAYIDDYAFDSCIALEKITLPESVCLISDHAFVNCSSALTAYVAEGSYAHTWCLENGVDFAFAGSDEGEAEYSYTDNGDGTCTITEYTGSDAALEIPAQINGLRVTGIGEEAFATVAEDGYLESTSWLGSVVIPQGVTWIGDNAFALSANLTQVTLPDSLLSIGISAFEGCDLQTLDLPDGITTISSWAFSGNADLSAVDLPASLNEIGKLAFGSCYSLEEYAIEESNAYYKVAGNVLYTKDGTQLVMYPLALEGPFAVPEGVTEIKDYAFGAALGLTEVTMPSTLRVIGQSAFNATKKLKTITLNDGLESIGTAAFTGSGVESICIPEGVAEIPSNAFLSCSSLKTVKLPSALTRIGKWAFNECGSLEYLTLPDHISEIGSDAFGWGTRAAYPLYVNAGTTTEKTLADAGWEYEVGLPLPIMYIDNGDGTATVADYDEAAAVAVIPSEWKGLLVTTIAEGAFDKLQEAAIIDLPDSVIVIEDNAIPAGATVRSSYNAYARTWALANGIVWKHNIHTEVVNEAVPATCRQSGLTEGRYCSVCSEVLQEQQIVPILDHEPAREGCLPATKDEDGLKAALGCSICNIVDEEQQVILSSQSVFLPAVLQEVQAEAFMGAFMQQVTIPEGAAAIGSKAFAECENLLLVVIPDSVIDIEEDAFENSDQVLLMCSAESYAAQWAEAAGVETVILN